ncbi:DUF481 domain-containing protein [Aquipseudomonas ullengensis]|uniref:DUF481 domain-containing protein n=1 Tax=Aquipseudomonas ullengensis TaxID=2759166 RepID=A0A7W4LLW3_9GAMM|nr:DUF481 domain-containing protein [Pseudomonas ullengensis]MBB2495564.1 DUF481 domain-containing protein [Pseudomonas ullengensis]
MTFSRSLLCLALGAFSSPLLADTVWLKNGDKLTGTIQLFDGGKLLLKTDYAGSITLDMNKVSTLESTQEMLVKQDDFVGEHAKSLRPAGEGMVELVNGEAPKQVALSSISQMLPPKPLVQDLTWTGNIDLSADYKQAENDTKDYAIDVDTKARHGAWRHGVVVQYDQETKDDEKKTDRSELDYDLDRFFTEKFFWQGQLKYTHDRIEDLETQRTIGTGPGYQFWDDELGAFSVAGLVNRNDYTFANGETEHFNSGSFEWDYKRYLIGKNFELFSKGELGAPFTDAIEYEFDTEAGVRYKLSSWASLSLKAEWDKVSSENGDTDERRYMMGLGVGW